MKGYCGERHADGWYCVLRKGHQGSHLSLDNSKIWEGSPGAPVFWETELPEEHTDEFNPTLTQEEYKQAQRMREVVPSAEDIRRSQTMGFTGELCGTCGSPNTVRNGKCLLCMNCKTTGECG